MTPVFESYRDSPEGARGLLADFSDLPGVAGARLTPDPVTPGCWLAESKDRSWRALVYVGNHPLSGEFEVVE